MSTQTKSSARTITVVRPPLCDFCDPGGNKVWIDTAFFDSARQFLFCTGERINKQQQQQQQTNNNLGLKRPSSLYIIWPTSYDLPSYLTYKLWPTFIFDLQALTYLYIWPANSSLSLYLTCQLRPTFIFELQAPAYLHIWPASSDLPKYLICQLWPFILDLPALTYLYIWPASSDLPKYLICQLWPIFIFDLPGSDLPLYLTCKRKCALPCVLVTVTR